MGSWSGLYRPLAGGVDYFPPYHILTPYSSVHSTTLRTRHNHQVFIMPLINVSRRTRRGMELSWPNNFALPDRPVPHFGRHGANLRRLALRERVEIGNLPL